MVFWKAGTFSPGTLVGSGLLLSYLPGGWGLDIMTGASHSQVGLSLSCNSVTLGSLTSQNLFPHLHFGHDTTLLSVVEKIT